MKKTLIALAALAATSAFAQSSVTISGSIQYGASRNAAGVTSYGALKGDRNFLNFGGVEDLGGGTNATFTLQQRFRSETGMAATYYRTDAQVNPATGERNSFEQTAIGLNNKDFGSIRVGRFTNILGFNSYNLMEDSGNGAGTSAQNGRLSGQFQYTSPKFAGFEYVYLNANKALNKYGTLAGNGYGSATATNATQNLVAHTLKYTDGPIFAQVSIVDGLTGEKSTHLGGTYALGGGLKLAAGQFRQQDALVTASNTQSVHNNTAVGAEYTTGPWVTAVMFSKANAKVASTDTGKKEQLGLKAYYFLSKRTSIDLEASNTKNVSTASDGTAYYAGVRHTF